MNATKITWTRRIAAGAVLAAAPALIALGTAAASHAAGDTGYTTPSPNYSPTPSYNTAQYPYDSWHHRHQAGIQSWYQ